MRALSWIAVLALNVAVAVPFVASMFQDAPATTRLMGGIVATTFVGVSVLLLLTQLGKLPSWGAVAMRLL